MLCLKTYNAMACCYDENVPYSMKGIIPYTCDDKYLRNINALLFLLFKKRCLRTCTRLKTVDLLFCF